MIRVLASLACALALATPAAAQTLTVTGLDGAAKTLAAADLAGLPRARAAMVENKKKRIYEGPLLSHVLRAAGLPMGQRLHGDPLRAYLVITGADGFAAVFAMVEVDRETHADTVILADRVDGAPLDSKHGPWRVVSVADRKTWRSVYAVTAIEAHVVGKGEAAMDHGGH